MNQQNNSAIIFLSILKTLHKGFSVFYFLLLPILLALKLITAVQLGYIGTLLIVGILMGASLVYFKLHVFKKIYILSFAYLLLLGSAILLFWYTSILFLTFAYILIGLAVGLGFSSLNALTAQFTVQGKRFKILAVMSMLADTLRVIYPLIAGIIFTKIGFVGLIYFSIFTVIIYGIFLILFACKHTIDIELPNESQTSSSSIWKNRPFLFTASLEFLDSFASSQLFVFLPAFLIFKNFTIENALIMQSTVFVGYLCGRSMVGWLATRYDGFKAVGIAEIGMIISIILLLVSPASNILYGFCFLLGVFSRGTSPVIKALLFDHLSPAQFKRGSAVYLISGEAGSALGQLVFSLLLAWLGVVAPFIAAAIFAALVALACLTPRMQAAVNP